MPPARPVAFDLAQGRADAGRGIVPPVGPAGRARMRRGMGGIYGARVDPRPVVAHRLRLDEIERACALFAHRRDGVLEVAITP